MNLKLNPICAGYCALCLSCLLKICCPFSAQLAICGAQHLLTLTDFKCLANIPVWLWRKQKLCFYSTPSSEGVESIRGNSVCKHRKSSNFNFLSNIYRHTCYCLSSLKRIREIVCLHFIHDMSMGIMTISADIDIKYQIYCTLSDRNTSIWLTQLSKIHP